MQKDLNLFLFCLSTTEINLGSYDDADHLEFPLKQIGSEILSFQQAQDILIDIYYNCIWAHM